MDGKLKRIVAEEFGFQQLLRAGNGDSRGLWSDGGVIYVAVDRDGKVYTYHMPDAIDARLVSLELSEIAITRFLPVWLSYDAVLGSGLTETTVQTIAVQEEATVLTAPADTDANPENGHQPAMSDLPGVTRNEH